MKKPKGIIQRAVLPKSWNTPKRQNQESFAYTVKTEHVGWCQELPWIWTGTTERCGRERERKTQTCYLWRSLWVRLHVKEDQLAVHLHCLGRKQRLKTLRVFPLMNTKPQVIEELTTSMKTIIIRTRTSIGSVPRNYKRREREASGWPWAFLYPYAPSWNSTKMAGNIPKK